MREAEMSDAEKTTQARRVAVTLTDGAARRTVEHLMADCAEALAVYARLAGAPAPELVDDARGCDAVLLGWSGDEEAELAGLVGAPVYALCAGGEKDGGLEAARQAVVAAGGVWMGGVAVADSAFVLAAASSPRMGALRRGVSEAVDRLILALLAEREADEAVVRPPRPRWLWRMVAGAQGAPSLHRVRESRG